MVRTDGFTSLYRHNTNAVGVDGQNYGGYVTQSVAPVKKHTNYYNTMQTHWDNYREHPQHRPPPKYPPGLGISSFASPRASDGDGWGQQSYRPTDSSNIHAMNLSPRGGMGQYTVPAHTVSPRYHANVNTPYQSPYKINSKRVWRVNKTAGKKTGAITDFGLAKSAVSNEGPTWWMANPEIPINKVKTKRPQQKEITPQAFEGAAGWPSGAVLDDSAQSSDAPLWMTRLPHVPRPPPVKPKVGQRVDFGDHCFEGAAGVRTGAVLDDTAESGDSPRWMRMIPGVHRSKVDWKMKSGRDFMAEYTPSRQGMRSGAVLDDSAVSGDAPSFFHIKGVPKSTVKEKSSGWKTNFKPHRKDGKAAGITYGASTEDGAISDNVPDFMCIPGIPRVPRLMEPKKLTKARVENAFEGAAGADMGSHPNKSAVSGMAPAWMKQIKNVPQTKNSTLRASLDGFQKGDGTFGGYNNKNLDSEFADTAISQNAPDFMHIPGIPTVKDKREGVEIGMKTGKFESHCTGGDSTISRSAPDWMRSNPHVPLALDEYRDWGQSKHTYRGGEVGKGMKSDMRNFKQPDIMSGRNQFTLKAKNDNYYRDKPQKFPLGGNRIAAASSVAPVDSMKGAVSHAKADGDMLPMGMQGALVYGNPEQARAHFQHISPRIKEMAKSSEPIPQGTVLFGGQARKKEDKTQSTRPQTKMKGSVSFAKHDWDELPMKNWAGTHHISPRVRKLTRSRVSESRGVGVSELAGGRKQILLNEFGGGNHASFTSKDAPTFMDNSPKTARAPKKHGRGAPDSLLNGGSVSMQSPRWMKANDYVPVIDREHDQRNLHKQHTPPRMPRSPRTNNSPRVLHESINPPSSSAARNQRLFTPCIPTSPMVKTNTSSIPTPFATG